MRLLQVGYLNRLAKHRFSRGTRLLMLPFLAWPMRLDHRGGFAFQKSGQKPIIPPTPRIFIDRKGRFPTFLNELAAFRQRRAGLFSLAELMVRHRQNGLGAGHALLREVLVEAQTTIAPIDRFSVIAATVFKDRQRHALPRQRPAVRIRIHGD